MGGKSLPCEFCRQHVFVKPRIESREEILARRGLLKADPKNELKLVAFDAVANSLFSFQLDALKLALAVTFYIANVMDYYTTKRGLEAGLKEGNPFARTIMHMGWRKYQLFKLVGPLPFVYQALTSDDPYYVWTASLVVGTAMFAYAAIQNTILIAGMKIGEKEEVVQA